jgi:two-component sensor histidine kinase
VANAIRHAPAPPSQPLEVSWDVDASGVTVRVADSSDSRPVPRAAEADEPGGRGLRIVAEMSDGWGVDPAEGGGKRVWAHVPLRSAVTAP